MKAGSRPRRGGPDTITAAQSTRPTVVELRGRATDRTQARALSAVHRHLREAREAIDQVLAGDIDLVFTVDMIVIQAVRTTMANGLSTCRGGRPPCRRCGSDSFGRDEQARRVIEISAGRCWGCGSPPPGRAS